ncbi:unnamed protein product [Cunninghamella echinulata]
MQRLRKEAEEKGSLVVPLLGNHEIMNLGSDFRYVTEEEIATFGGWDARVKAFQPDGFIGSYLVPLNITTKVGRSVFCHGGIHPAFAQLGLDQINDFKHQDILKYMEKHGRYDPHHVFGGHGPTWYRGYALDDEPDICEVADTALRFLKADRMIMGHTVQRDGEIRTRCNGKIILIDIGISWVYGGYIGALEIIGDGVNAIYEHGKVELVPPSTSEKLDQPQKKFIHQELK